MAEEHQEYLTKLPPPLLFHILEFAIEENSLISADNKHKTFLKSVEKYKDHTTRNNPRHAAQILASLACTCQTFRQILAPLEEEVVCDIINCKHYMHSQDNQEDNNHPHSWYFDSKGFVNTDDLHAFTLGGNLWKAACTHLLGSGVCHLHAVCAAFTDGVCRENAVFWRNLCRESLEMRIFNWSKGAVMVLKHNAKIQDDVTSKQMILDPDILKAQKVLSATQTPRCIPNGPCKPCFMLGRSLSLEDTTTLQPEVTSNHANADEGSLAQERTEAEKLLRSRWQNLSSTLLLDKRLPRSGHCAVSIGDFIVIVGGFCPANLPIVDVLVIHLDTLRISCPEVLGSPPPKRFRQTLNCIEPGSESQLATGKTSDYVLLMYGGYDALGMEYGGHEIYTLTITPNAQSVRWTTFQTSGQAPTPRYNHSAEAVQGKQALFVYGGEGEQVDGTDVCGYFLEFDNLIWRRVPTFANFKDGSTSHPGSRSLHYSTLRKNSLNGIEEVIIFGGFSPSKDGHEAQHKRQMYDMTPYALDIETMIWSRSKQEQSSIPLSRHRAAPFKTNSERLLLVGGVSDSGLFLENIEQLNIKTLEWEEPPLILGQPSQGLRHIAGSSAAGLVVFGGTTTNIFGIQPVTKLDVLLIGPPHETMAESQKNESTHSHATTPVASPRPKPKKKGSIASFVSDFFSKLIPNRYYFENFNMQQHHVLARHRMFQRNSNG